MNSFWQINIVIWIVDMNNWQVNLKIWQIKIIIWQVMAKICHHNDYQVSEDFFFHTFLHKRCLPSLGVKVLIFSFICIALTKWWIGVSVVRNLSVGCSPTKVYFINLSICSELSFFLCSHLSIFLSKHCLILQGRMLILCDCILFSKSLKLGNFTHEAN